jgi:hypothetical protein
MNVKTLHEIHDEGINTLRKTRGSVDMVRFIQMFDHGTGDYTKERRQWLRNDLDEICNEIFEMQKTG